MLLSMRRIAIYQTPPNQRPPDGANAPAIQGAFCKVLCHNVRASSQPAPPVTQIVRLITVHIPSGHTVEKAA